MNWMKATERIASYKRRYKADQRAMALRCLALPFGDFPVSEIHRRIRKMVSANGMDIGLARFCMATCRKAALLRKGDAESDFLLLMAFYSKSKVFESEEKAVGYIANRLEEREKERLIGRMEGEAEKEIRTESGKDNRIFYLCSAHGDCAKDHLPYQGKIYVDANWQSLADQRTADYILSRGFKTIQWAMSAPAFLLTRPNCRHYFVQLKPSEVMGFTEDELIERYGAYSPIGLRGESFRLPMTQEEAYAESAYRKHEARLSFLQEIAKNSKAKGIKAEIGKEKRILAKWKALLKKEGK